MSRFHVEFQVCNNLRVFQNDPKVNGCPSCPTLKWIIFKIWAENCKNCEEIISSPISNKIDIHTPMQSMISPEGWLDDEISLVDFLRWLAFKISLILPSPFNKQPLPWRYRRQGSSAAAEGWGFQGSCWSNARVMFPLFPPQWYSWCTAGTLCRSCFDWQQCHLSAVVGVSPPQYWGI